ncbi:MAG: Hsp33 family molecular chaperone HslO [Halioglobus sp.]
MSESNISAAEPTDDIARRFLFDQADIRGETVHVNRVLEDILANHQYAPGVCVLLGEFVAAAVLLSSTLKFEGKLILQVRSEGQIPLLMVECNNHFQVRAIARGAQEATATDFDQLLADGQLAITIDPDKGQRYQGIVPLVNGSLARSLDAYFENSEQLHTRLWLASDGSYAAGMLVQQLPAQVVKDTQQRQEQWQHVCSLAGTLTNRELLDLIAQDILVRLFHEDPVRLFEPRGVTFHCTCSRERTFGALASLPPGDVRELLEEIGHITMDCEFCNQQYLFSADDLKVLIEGEDPHTLH